MTAFETYCLWNALHLHFQSDSYNFFLYNGKTKVSQKSFDNNYNKAVFYKLSRKFTGDQLMDYFLANLLYEEKVNEHMLPTPEFELNFKQYIKRKQSLFNVFANDIQRLVDLCEINNRSFMELFAISSKHKGALHYPQLKVYVDFGEIAIETFIILDLILNFTVKWDEYLNEDKFWLRYKKRCESYKPFLEKAVNSQKYKQKLKELIGITRTL